MRGWALGPRHGEYMDEQTWWAVRMLLLLQHVAGSLQRDMRGRNPGGRPGGGGGVLQQTQGHHRARQIHGPSEFCGCQAAQSADIVRLHGR